MEEEKTTAQEVTEEQLKELAERASSEINGTKRRGRPPGKRSERIREEIRKEIQAEQAENIEILTGAVAMGVITITSILEEGSPNWKPLQEDELETLTKATETWLKVRAAWFAKFAPEMQLAFAWGGYFTVRVREKRRLERINKPKEETKQEEITQEKSE